MKMSIFRNYKIKESMKFISILKFYTLTLLIWICYLNIDKCTLDIYLENEYKVQRLSFECFNRLLARNEIQRELKYPKSRANLSYNTIYMNAPKVLEGTSTYGLLRKKEVNDLDSYKRSYKRRYSKKYGLAKFECHCEKKVFDKIDDFHNLVENLKNDENMLKKKLWHKFGIRFILFFLIPVFGLIVPMVYNRYFQLIDTCFHDCVIHKHLKRANGTYYHDDDAGFPSNSLNTETWFAISTANFIFSCITLLIVLFVFIYIFIKFVKYEKLKAGKGKMGVKEYCKFCKSLFI